MMTKMPKTRHIIILIWLYNDRSDNSLILLIKNLFINLKTKETKIAYNF